jgi:ATP-dependent DNA helicase RecQ
MKQPTHTTTLRHAAESLFGWTELRPNQLAAMRAVMERRDALVVLPTGAGKSAIYQIPASLIPGPTVVISPLLALQQDQIARSTSGSARSCGRPDQPGRRPSRPRRSRDPRRPPSSLHHARAASNPDRMAEVRSLKPALVAIDEAHCISA